MLKTLFAVFLILHGLVHLLYLGQSVGAFELQPGLTWPQGSWALTRILGTGMTRRVATLSLALLAVAFSAGGLGLLTRQSWWQPLIIGASLFSSSLFVLLWDGQWQHLDDKGAVGLLLNLAILSSLLGFHWPDLT